MILNELTGEAVIDGTDVHVIFTGEAFLAVERMLGGKATTAIVADAAVLKVGFTDLQALIAAGAEAWRRRTGAGGKPFNPARAMKVIDEGGGLFRVAPQVIESMLASTAMGANAGTGGEGEGEEDEEDEESVPFAGPESSPD